MTAFSVTIAANDATGPAAVGEPWSNAAPIKLEPSGWIFGYLFRRERPSGRVICLDPDEQLAVIESAGTYLLRHYWGGYVAVLPRADGSVHVLRDPSGLMPCYVRRRAESMFLASDIGALAAPGSARIDFNAITAIMASVDRRGRRTGIAGIEELLPGERLIIEGASNRTEQAWSPFDYVRPPHRITFDQAAEELRETIKDAVGAWASSFDSILLGVSGGLDSSIVAAAAIARTPGLRFLTMAEPGTDGDERRYVNALTAKLGPPLTAKFYDIAAVDVERPVLPHLPLPVAMHFAQAIEAAHDELATASTIDAYFSGNGGDNVFCSLRTAVPLVDRLLAEGPRPGIIGTLSDIADLTGADIPSVIKHACDRFRRRRSGHRIFFDLSGLTPSAAVIATDVDDRHPWLDAPAGTLPGKAAHVALLARAQMSIELYPRREAPPHIAPLLSQPIVELCLSIPSWHWVAGGRNRALARRAFEDALPAMLIARTSKGSPSGFLARVYDAQAARAGDLLRRGRLVEMGILDPDFVERAVQLGWRDDGSAARLLAFAAAETWVRWWEAAEPPEA